MPAHPNRPAFSYQLRSSAPVWGVVGSLLVVAVGWPLGGLRSIPDFTWFLAAAVLWGDWELYTFVTITTTEVVVRPATGRKIRVRVPREQVAVAGHYATSGRSVAWYALPPGTLHFSLEFTEEDAEGNPCGEAIIIRYNGQQLEGFLASAHWPSRRAALLAMGNA